MNQYDKIVIGPGRASVRASAPAFGGGSRNFEPGAQAGVAVGAFVYTGAKPAIETLPPSYLAKDRDTS
ncbi:MAG: hypothetical protein WB816_16335 [Methylocystis sp.]